MGEWAVELIDVHAREGARRILRGADLGIRQGEIVVVVGPSGAGKSLLAALVSGLAAPDHGDVIVAGRSVPRMRRAALAAHRRELGVLLPGGGVFADLTVGENLAFTLRQQRRRVHSARLDDLVARALERFQLTPLAERRVEDLAPAVTRLVGCARALVACPRLAVLDDPAAGLDPMRAALVCRGIRDCNDEHGTTFLITSRDPHLAHTLGDHGAVLWRGRVLAAGPITALSKSEEPLVRRYMDTRAQARLELGHDLGLDRL